MSLTIASTDAGDPGGAGRIGVSVAAEWHHPPARTFLRLRHPDRRRIAALTVAGASHRRYDDETIELTELTASARLVATLER